jgi:pheganomycin biosynthesis PGM1-like protein
MRLTPPRLGIDDPALDLSDRFELFDPYHTPPFPSAVDGGTFCVGMDRTTEFDALQRKLVPLWKSIQSLNQDEQTIVVVPSLTMDLPFMSGSELQAYEERLLFMLMLLRQPRAHLVYVTSLPIDPLVVDYELSLLPGVIPSHARARLHLLSPRDGSTTPLANKLLARPRLLAEIRALIPDPDRAHLVPFVTTEAERDLSLALGIPMYAADPKHLDRGTKSGGRRLFAEEGVSHPDGAENVRTVDDVVDALAELLQRRPDVHAGILKHDAGVSGEGNASIDLTGVDAGDRGELERRVREMRLESSSTSPETYLSVLEREGGVVEERVAGQEVRSPSVQMRVTPLGELEILSTHDQLLGGPSGQAYLGATFPADSAYAAAITREAAKIGSRLASEGVLGRFAVDFVVVDRGGEWQPYAVEINLRKGGTTHPFLTLQFLTDGTYDPERAVFTAPNGRTKCFVASDHAESEAYRGLMVEDLFDIAVRHGLHFDHSRQTGIVYHMLASLGTRGRFGLTAVEDSPGEAMRLYERTLAIIDDEVARSE